MRRYLVLSLCLTTILLFSLPRKVRAAEGPSVNVSIQGPTAKLQMGNTPTFTGTVSNVGSHKLQGLVVYLSLVSLQPGNEHPMDLEDWSAQKAVRIDQLMPGQGQTTNWHMRLIQAGKFGVALTVVNPGENRPIVSNLVPFDIQTKPTLNANRIIPVACGEPLLLLTVLAVAYWTRIRVRRPRESIHA